MYYPESAISYQLELHNALLEEIAEGIPYDHACGMMAIEIAKRLFDETGDEPALARVKPRDQALLLPRIYNGNDGFGTHMVAVRKNIVYDPLAASPLHTAAYMKNVFLNKAITIHYCESDYTYEQIHREEPTTYENGLPSVKETNLATKA